MLVVLSGILKNVGDALITDRTLALLRHVLPDEELVVLPRGIPLDENAELVGRARGVVIAGGPGINAHMWPDVYPLFHDPGSFKRLDTKLHFLGVGWFDTPGDVEALDRFRFMPLVQAFLEYSRGFATWTTRDLQSAKVLRRAGMDATVTGCPVWYDLRHTGERFTPPECIRRIVFTTPQSPMYPQQAIAALQVVREAFPAADIVTAFHRGIEPDRYTSEDESRRLRWMADMAWKVGTEVRDVSYELDRIAFYDDCDLHVGYRVHGHLRFLAARKPSILLEEDGRGGGFTQVLGAPAAQAWRYANDEHTKIAAREDIPEWLAGQLADFDYEACENAVRVIDDTLPVMVEHITGW